VEPDRRQAGSGSGSFESGCNPRRRQRLPCGVRDYEIIARPQVAGVAPVERLLGTVQSQRRQLQLAEYDNSP
jgi:hypothetical protein